MKSIGARLSFLTDGTIQGFYTEVIDLTGLGRLAVRRVTTIEFDPSDQIWRVLNRNRRCLFSAPSRTECLRWEEEHIHRNEQL